MKFRGDEGGHFWYLSKGVSGDCAVYSEDRAFPEGVGPTSPPRHSTQTLAPHCRDGRSTVVVKGVARYCYNPLVGGHFMKTAILGRAGTGEVQKGRKRNRQVCVWVPRNHMQEVTNQQPPTLHAPPRGLS